MRNLSEQKKTFSPLIAFFFMAIIFAIIFLVFYLNAIDITASVSGIRFYDFEDELVKVDDYDIDEGDAMLYMEKGSKVIAMPFSSNAFTKFKKASSSSSSDKDASFNSTSSSLIGYLPPSYNIPPRS